MSCQKLFRPKVVIHSSPFVKQGGCLTQKGGCLTQKGGCLTQKGGGLTKKGYTRKNAQPVAMLSTRLFSHVNNVVTALFNHQYCYNLLTRLNK